MPELPDLTVYIEHLQARVQGAELRAIRLTSPFLLRSVSPSVEEMCGREVLAVRRLAKQIVIELATEHFMVIHDNLMYLRGDHGAMALQVFWPSAGVHSIIIFSLVMGAFLLKMNIPRNRKAVYFGLGILGTITVNVIRIFSLSVYALKVTTDAEKWEEFHSFAGEIMFLPWLFIFLLIVTTVETRRMKKNEAAAKLDSEN